MTQDYREKQKKLCDICGHALVNSVLIKEAISFWDIKPAKIAYRTIQICIQCYNKTGLQKIEKGRSIWIVHNNNSLKEFHDRIF